MVGWWYYSTPFRANLAYLRELDAMMYVRLRTGGPNEAMQMMTWCSKLPLTDGPTQSRPLTPAISLGCRSGSGWKVKAA